MCSNHLCPFCLRLLVHSQAEKQLGFSKSRWNASHLPHWAGLPARGSRRLRSMASALASVPQPGPLTESCFRYTLPSFTINTRFPTAITNFPPPLLFPLVPLPEIVACHAKGFGRSAAGMLAAAAAAAASSSFVVDFKTFGGGSNDSEVPGAPRLLLDDDALDDDAWVEADSERSNGMAARLCVSHSWNRLP